MFLRRHVASSALFAAVFLVTILRGTARVGRIRRDAVLSLQRVLSTNGPAPDFRSHNVGIALSSDSASVSRAAQKLADNWCYALIDEVWSASIWQGRAAPNGSNVSLDFDKHDAATKEGFIARCSVTFNTSRFAVPTAVLSDMCGRVGGTSDECGTLVERLWRAYNASEIEPWCASTFDWFANKTMPRCNDRCSGLLCKSRCAAHDHLNDLEDERELLAFKLGRLQNRTLELQQEQIKLNETRDLLDKLNETELAAASAEVRDLKRLVTNLSTSLNKSAAAAASATAAKDRGRAALDAARKAAAAENKTETKATKEAQAALDTAYKALTSAREEKAAANKRVKDAESSLTKARALETAKLAELNELAKEYESQKKKVTDEAASVAAEEGKLQDAMKRVDEQIAPVRKALASKS
eukprot:TRINITY_DN14858_c1_g9_i1.p1 TRINITY_DN14858_c1_g9~~TRINITY_DN14858_c1_g9_i1.p1  ORF type:complete len:429 (+),score=79.87 TRINITY_DN14858_c1_g9_i1:51-1289(+)